MKKTDYEPKFEKPVKSRAKAFIKRNFAYGMFILVLVAVCAATVWGIIGITSNEEPLPTAVVGNQTPANATSKPVSTPPASEKPVINEGDGDTDVSKPNTTFKLSYPFEKKRIITEYSEDKPIFSETLDEWSCHTGIDFACEQGANVAAASNGIVKEVTNDALYGTSVLICHADDYYTLYCGLKDVSVAVDELVAEGQSLGVASGDIPSEAHMDCHVHFEVIKDGLSVDPSSFT